MASDALQQRSEAGLSRRDLRTVYAVEFTACLGTNLLLLGVYFYTHERLGWTLRQNFMLAAGQGLVGAVGSLLAHSISGRFGRRGALVGIYAAMAGLAGAALFAKSSVVITALLLAYTLFVSFSWPLLESLVSTGVHGHSLSRRVGTYNLFWSSASAAILAVNGALIQYVPWAVFVVPVVVHALGAGVIATVREPAGGATGHDVEAEPGLVAVRRLALALSRVSLPATYILIYSLMAMLPSLAVIRSLAPVAATAVCSVWMGSRWVTFWVLGATVWWHERPRVLLAAAVAMVPAFLVIVLPGARLWAWHDASNVGALAWMVGGQLLLGVCVGVIYSGSLYFGMALSGGSAEHGGYHESLINFGSAVGPIAGVCAEVARPGDVRASVVAVTGVIGLSVLATCVTAVVARGMPAAKDI